MADIDEWLSPKLQAEASEKARSLRDQATKVGLKFEAFLPSGLALWLLDKIEQGEFINPAQAAYELLKQTRELEPHADLRDELTRRSVQAAIDDPRPPIDAEALMKKMEEIAKRPAEKAAVWEKQSRR
jgi:antitoxin ParD1/3/4